MINFFLLLLLSDTNQSYQSFSLDKLIARLKKDSDSISKTLEFYQAERNNAIKFQRECLHEYDLQMIAIGDGDMDDAEIEELPPVDHAVMAHLNINNSSDGNLNLATLNLDETNPDMKKTTKRIEKEPPVVQIRDNYMPDFHEKTRMRDELFNFMENSKIDEIQLELECDKLRDEGGPAFERAADILLAVQRRNNENLQNMFKDYKSVPFGKAWGNDVDYIDMTNKLKKMINSSDNKGSDDRTKPKPKKKYGKPKAVHS